MGELDNFGSFLIQIIINTSVLLDCLLLAYELSDVDSGSACVFLNEVNELLKVVV